MLSHTYRNRIRELKTKYDTNKANLAAEEKVLQRDKKQLAAIEQAQVLAQKVAQEIQQHAHKELAGIVRLCLRNVFGEGYDFRIDFKQRRNKTEGELVLVKDGHDVGDAMGDDSGGVLDIGSFALRTTNLLTAKPERQLVLFLDEPFKFLSVKYRPALIQLIETLASNFNIQFLFVTHIPDLAMGKVVQL
jgi:DNA repair exonuclease SbcCD ATPase subunit